MGGLRTPRFDLSKPYDLYGGRSRADYLDEYDRSLSPQRAAVMNRLKPSSPSVYERYGRPALEAVGGVVSAPFRGLGQGLTALQETLADTPDSESRLRLNGPGTSVLDDILGKSVTSAPSPAALALEGYKGIGEELARDLFPDVLETPSAGRTPEDARAYAKEFPVISRAQSVLDPVTELAFQFVTDPALAGFGALSKSTEAAKTAQAALESGVLPRGAAAAAEAAVSRGRVANIAERALGASFVPGMAEAAFHGGTAAADSFRREGLSPETLRAGTEATLSAILAGTGAAHAVTPGLRPTASPREALNPVLDDILGRAPEVRQEAPAPAVPLVTAPPPVAVPTDLAAIDELVANAAPPRPEAPPPVVVPEPVAPAPLAPTAGPAVAPAPDIHLRQAEVLARQAGKATVGDLVNGLGVSPSKARRLLGQLEEQGVLGASDKNGVRAVAGAKPAEPVAAAALEAPPVAAVPVPAAPAAEEAPKPHKFSSTQVNLPEPIAQKVRAISDSIPDADLGTEGREQNPHVTVKYGLHTDDVAEVRKVLAGEPPIKVKLGKTSLFPPSESSSGADVLKVDVDSPDLHRLNAKISKALETTDTHPEYKPHVTLAYVKAGEGKKYAGNEALAGQEMTLDHVTFTTRDGQVHEIPLGGTGEASVAASNVREEAAPAIHPSSVGDRLGSLSERGGNRGEVATPAADASPVPPTFQEWLGNRRVPNDPNYVKGLREEYLKAYPNADRAQFQPGGGPKSAPFVEPKPEPVDVAGLKARAAEEARKLVPDADVDRDLAENVAPALARGIDKGQRRAGISSVKPELGIEGVSGDPKTLVRAIKQDADNPKYLELKEARRAAMADDRAPTTAPAADQPRGPERRQQAVHPVVERRLVERREAIATEKPHLQPADVEDLAQAQVAQERHRLTGLPERELFDKAVAEGRYGAYASADGRAFGILNKTHGHVAGDSIIKAMADIIHEAVTPHGVDLFHTGGDEFRLGGKDINAVRKAAEAAQADLFGATIEHVGPDGKTSTIELPEVDFGYGTRFEDADAELGAIKLARKRAAESGAVAPEPSEGREPDASPEGRPDVPAVRSGAAPRAADQRNGPDLGAGVPRSEGRPGELAAPPQYSVRPSPGQRGLPGLGEDVAPPREKTKKPEQSSMFGGEMLQASESRTTEGREGGGALFTQDQDARARAEGKSQGGLFDTEEREHAEAPRAEATAPATTARPAGIADFGEKIGGARKDVAKPLGPRAPKPEASEPEGPAWRRPYRVFQDARDVTRMGEGQAPWRIAKGDSIVYRSGRETAFKTRAEAEAALPLMEVSRNHRVYRLRDQADYGIYRQITERKRVLVRGGFESDEAAKRYMAQNPEEIIGHKFPMPDKPWLDHIEREGPSYRNGDVQPQQFQETFGFRGGEFGNWNMGSDGQAALNHAYDGLMDLSRALGVPEKALSLDGKLAIAFGARGHGGKDSARAHYEPDRAVINLTKIKGAGSLAHEWFHALDHYLSGEAGAPATTDTLSRGFPHQDKTRPELRKAFERVMREVTASEKTQAVDGGTAEKFQGRMAEGVTRILDDLRNNFTYKPYNERMRLPTPEELAQFDAIAERIKAGEVGGRKIVEGKARMAFRSSYEPIEELNALYKKVRGHSFATADPGSRGRQLASQVDSMLVARKRVESAKAGESETKRGPSDFLRNSRDIDQYRASDYWSTPHEMAARAFEAFVHDKLVGGKERSDYLAHGVENKYYAMLDMKPYPEGAERQAINGAFEDLFKTIKTKETERGTALYRATGGPEAGSLTLADIRKHIRAPGITETPEGFQFRVGQTGVRIDRVGDIHLEPKAFESGRPGQSPEGLQAVGSYQRVGDLATIKLLAKEGETPRTLLHEAWHLVKDLGLLREGELKAIEKKYGANEEAQADAYADWNPATRPDGLFGKIASFFRNIYRSFRPSAESAFEKVRSGKAFEGAAGEAIGEPKYATAPKTTPSQVRPIPPGSVPGQAPLAPAAPGGHATAPAPHLNLPEATLADKVATYFQDRLRRLGVVETAVGAQGGKVAPAGENVKAAYDALGAKGAAKVEDIRQRYVDPLVSTIAKAKASLKDLDDYVSILHAPDRDAAIERRTDGKVKNGSGWTDTERQARWAELEKKYGTGPDGRITGLEPAAKIVRDMRDEQLRVLQDGGLISAEQAQAWKREMGDHYVPLRTAEVDAGMGTGQGFDIRGKESKAATGRSTKADSPVTFMLQQLERAAIRAGTNKADQKFADFIRENSLFEMDKDHTRTELGPDGKVRTVGDSLRAQKDFSYKVDGETHRIDIASTDPLLDAAMRNLSANERNIVVDHLGKLSRHFSKAVTSMNPAFMFTNFARDIQEAAANAGVEHGATVAKNVVQGVPHAMAEMYRLSKDPTKATPMAREFKEDGGAVGWYSVQGIPELEKELTSRINAHGPGFGPAVTRLWQRVGRAVSDANGSVENATRFSVYKALRDGGASREKAAHASRNATIDFTKRGEAGPTINALYTFFNANVQGMKRLKEIAIDTPKGRALAGSIVGAGLALDAYNRAMAGDANDDGTNDYDDIPEYVKRRNLVFMRGEGKKPLMIPLPYGFSVFQTIGRQVMSGMAGATKPGQAALNVLSAANNAFNPLGGESFVQMLSPTFLDPFVQHATNETWAGKPLKPEQFPGSPEKPASEMYFKNAPPLAISVARFLNEKTGGDTHTPGFISVSPEVLSLYADAANNMFGVGGYARTAVQAGETAKALASGETPSVRNIPVANRFVYEESPGLEGQKYRANVDELETLWGRFKSYREEGDTEKAGEIPRALLQAKKSVDAIDNRIRSLRRASKVRPDLQAKIGDLQRQANRIVANAKKQAP